MNFLGRWQGDYFRHVYLRFPVSLCYFVLLERTRRPVSQMPESPRFQHHYEMASPSNVGSLNRAWTLSKPAIKRTPVSGTLSCLVNLNSSLRQCRCKQLSFWHGVYRLSMSDRYTVVRTVRLPCTPLVSLSVGCLSFPKHFHKVIWKQILPWHCMSWHLCWWWQVEKVCCVGTWTCQ